MSPKTKTFPGRLIILEGVDGSGKTMLAEMLAKHITATGERAVYFSFPGREPGTLGAQIYELHHRARELGVNAVHPASLQLLHIAAHVDAIENRILPILRSGDHVVLDRYWWSTWVYGVVAKADAASLKAMIDVEMLHWASVRPAMAFLLVRAKGRDDDEETQRQRRIEEYHRLSAMERNDYPVRIVTNDGTVEDALEAILKGLGEIGWALRAKPTRAAPKIKQSQLPFGKSEMRSAPAVFTRLAPAKPTIVYESYWRFARERQKIFFARLENRTWPWTDDPILREYKFTNAYRASDRVSQHLIRHVIYQGDASPNEMFFRTLLFKVFNRIETWELLKRELGDITYASYSFKRYDSILTAAMTRGERVYSAAYIMPSGGPGAAPGRKHSMHLRLIERMIKEDLPEKMAAARTMAKAFELIRAYPTIGDFLAYQYVTDLNYGPLTSFSEMEFVVPGPGASSGLHKCFSDFGGLTEAELIKIVTDRQEQEFERLGLQFRNLWGRRLQLIDCQNLFCEVDKYSRVRHPEISGPTGRTRIKQRFEATIAPLDPWYPPKWGLNDKIRLGGRDVRAV